MDADRLAAARALRQVFSRFQKEERARGGKVTQQTVNENMGWGEGNGFFWQLLEGRAPISEEHALKLAKHFKCKAWDILPHLRQYADAMVDDQVAANDYEFVTSYRRRHAAGSGRQGHLDIDMDEVKMRLAFQRAWLIKKRLNIKTLEIGVFDGLSMLPKYEPGYTFLYDTAQREIMNRKVYALASEGMPRVKRLVKHGDMIEVASDNKAVLADGSPEYPSDFHEAEHAKRIIIGRVIWHCGDD